MEIEGNPFSKLNIASHEPLRGATRGTCPKCKSSRKYYCYDCYITVGIDHSLIPIVSLPIKLDIIKHQLEVSGKSTATHAAVLAPKQVTIYHYPDVPCFKLEDEVVLVYPSEDACTLQEVKHNHSDSHGGDTNMPFSRVVFIDGTWEQANKIFKDERLSRLKRVKIESAKTDFWRPQHHKPDSCLATIEAIYYFFKELDQYILGREYSSQYDNLLYFFSFQHKLIKQLKWS